MMSRGTGDSTTLLGVLRVPTTAIFSNDVLVSSGSLSFCSSGCFATKEERERILKAPDSSSTTASSVPSNNCINASLRVNVPSNALVLTRLARSNGKSKVVLACLASSVKASLASCAGIEKLNSPPLFSWSDCGSACSIGLF